MEQLSLLDKFKILFDNILEHPLFILLLLVPVIILLLQKKHGKKAFVFVYLLVLIFVLYIGGNVIFELFDNLMDGLFMTLYFPNFITLFVVVVLCSIIALLSFFSKKMYRINKIINITGFAIIQMLFVLILTLVKSKNINIYADNALYSNDDVLTLMQLLIGTFTLQVITIFIINGINKVTDILDRRSNDLSVEISDQIDYLKKTKTRKNLSKIKNIKIDDKKVGYINVADKKKTSKPKLKPFKFDLDKLESIKLNVPEDVVNEDMLINLPAKEDNEVLSVINPKPLTFDKPDLFSSMDEKKEVSPQVNSKNKFINKENMDNFDTIKVLGAVQSPKLVHTHEHSLDLIDNLNILDIQSTLDTVIKYKLMKDVKLQTVDDDLAVDNLRIPDFDKMVMALKKYKLYKKV